MLPFGARVFFFRLVLYEEILIGGIYQYYQYNYLRHLIIFHRSDNETAAWSEAMKDVIELLGMINGDPSCALHRPLQGKASSATVIEVDRLLLLLLQNSRVEYFQTSINTYCADSSVEESAEALDRLQPVCLCTSVCRCVYVCVSFVSAFVVC